MSKSIYDDNHHSFESENFQLRNLSLDDLRDLLSVYSDKKSQKLFNPDNCHGDTFCYAMKERSLFSFTQRAGISCSLYFDYSIL